MKNKNRKAVMLGSLLSCMLLFAGCAGGQNAAEPAGETEGNVSETIDLEEDASGESDGKLGILQSFNAVTLEEDTFTQEDIAKADVTVINFWATYCGPCLAEMPDIAAFSESLPDNVQLITVCLDGAGDTESVKSILEDAGYDGVTLLTGDGNFQAVCREIMYIPTTIIVDKDGNMMGEAIIGGQKDLAQTYTDAVNSALASLGKAALGDEKN